MRTISLFFSLFLLVGCFPVLEKEWEVQSPDGQIRVQTFLLPDGQPAYRVIYLTETVIDTSRLLGLDLQDQPSIGKGMVVKKTGSRSVNDTWAPVWGEYAEVAESYNELSLELRESTPPNRKVRLVFRVFDDGLGFRYEFPEQEALREMVVLDENTEFQITADHMTWWIPGDWDIYEHLYSATPFSRIDALSKRNHPNLAQTYIPENAVNTPVTQRAEDGYYLSFHEASLYNYPAMTLKPDTARLCWVTELVGNEAGIKARVNTPFLSPWRTIQVAGKATGLSCSNLILNLNEPSRLEETDWIKPTKYMGIWWEMHLGKSDWNMAGGKHGATTENAKKYIDFASANGIGALLIEGWNTGWENWFGDKREHCFDFVTPYPDFDIREVIRYGKGKGVSLIGHHETASSVENYEMHMDSAFRLCAELGIPAVKTGYVGTIIPKGEYHQGQYMVNHYQKVIELAASHRVAIVAHETVKDTGIRRTWPNFLSREVFRGQEFNAWSIDMNPPEHLPNLAFTTQLAGPMDYTPGIFNIKFDAYKDKNQVNTTLAHQLALYVTIYSPVQMAADLPEHYQDQPAFQFIREVPVDWEKSVPLAGEVGDYYVVARKDKASGAWFLGAITDENARVVEIPLDFLSGKSSYQATLYLDGPGAHWDNNPASCQIETREIQPGQPLRLELAPGGGAAVVIR